MNYIRGPIPLSESQKYVSALPGYNQQPLSWRVPEETVHDNVGDPLESRPCIETCSVPESKLPL